MITPTHAPVRLRVLLSAVAVLCVMTGAARAQKVDKGKLDDAARWTEKAAKVLNDLAALPAEGAIPRGLFEHALAVAVFPEVQRVNVLVTKFMKGSGLMARRTPDGWGAPAFYRFAVMDRGWTLVKPGEAGIVMLFMTDEALGRFKKDGSGFKAAPGPVGGLTPEKAKRFEGEGVIIYAFSGGRLSGIEVDDDDTTQSDIKSDNNVNKEVYGLKAREVLWAAPPPAAAEAAAPALNVFREVLAHMPKP